MMRLFCSKCQKVFEAEKPADSSKVKCPLCGGEQDFPATVPGPGVVVGDFLIEKLLSVGGMGEVFLAKQISLDRPVALKVLQQKYLGDREYVDSLFKEARAAAKLSHPNIVQAYAVGEDNGIFYFAMEYIRGKTFKQILKEEKTIEFTRAATVIRDIAGALGAAWREQKLVHQDIKPDNIMLDPNGFAKLSDLGLAKVASGSSDDAAQDGDEVLGTPQYISPEQLTGVPTDIRSDLYSLGATFYHFVTGRFPYVADTGDEIARMHIEKPLQPPKQVNPKLPDELNRIIVKMMEKDINKRYQTAEELVNDLNNYLRKAPAVAASGARTASAAGAAKKPAMPKLSVPGRKAAAPAAKPVAPAVPVPAPASGAAQKPDPDAPANGEAEPEAEAFDEPRLSRPLKIALTVVAAVLLLVVAAGAALVICVKSKVALPAFLKPTAETVAGWFGVGGSGKPTLSFSERKKAEAEAAKRRALERERQEKERQEKELRERRKRAERARREREARERREREEQEERDRRERERLEREERERREQARRKRQAWEAQERRKREALERRLYDQLEADVVRAAKPLAEAFFAAANGDDAAFAKAQRVVDEIYLRPAHTEKERALLNSFAELRRELPGEAAKMRAFIAAIGDIQEEVYCSIPGVGLCRVVGLYPDGSAAVVKDGVRRQVPARSLRESRNFRKAMLNNVRDKNLIFHYGMMIRRFDPMMQRNAPAGFWKKNLKLFVKAAQAE